MSGYNPFAGRWPAIAFAGGVIWLAAAIAEDPPRPADRSIGPVARAAAAPDARVASEAPTPAVTPPQPVADPEGEPIATPPATYVNLLVN